MWKSRDEKPGTPATPPAVATPAAASYTPPREARSAEPSRSLDAYRAEVASIGKSVLIKGELSGSEDLYLDGEVEGNVELRDHSLIIGPNGRVRANIHARDVVIHGKVDGNVYGNERVELKKSAILVGDISTQRIVIEDGAYFKGAIDITKKEGGKSESRRESAGAAAYAGASATPAATVASAATAQSSLLEPKN
ncbi:MAG TPA: polymer-forming cytoskeletal protein [Terriglobales bacterium]|nr:polymer-forming cytoskeletal protein [Terriglobales bacterium]